MTQTWNEPIFKIGSSVETNIRQVLTEIAKTLSKGEFDISFENDNSKCYVTTCQSADNIKFALYKLENGQDATAETLFDAR